MLDSDGACNLVHTFFDISDTMVLSDDASWCRRDRSEGKIVRKAVIVGLLRLPKEETRVQHGMVGLRESKVSSGMLRMWDHRTFRTTRSPLSASMRGANSEPRKDSRL